MVIDMRYHLTSLVAVFFALGLGILIGTSLSSDGTLLKEQASMIDAIEGQLGQLRIERTRLEEELTNSGIELGHYKAFATSVLPRLVAGRLEGTTVAVVGFGEPELSDALEDVLRLAGANVAGSVRVQNAGNTANKISGIFTPSQEAAMISYLAAGLTATAWNQDVPAQAVDTVQWRKVADKRADWVVLVGQDASVEMARRLAMALRAEAVPVVATGGREAAASWLRTLKAAGIGTVANTETPMGQLELIDRLSAQIPAAKTAAEG